MEVPRLHAKDETVTQMLWPDHCVQGTHVSPRWLFDQSLPLTISRLRDAALKTGYKIDLTVRSLEAR
jgi:hypothetical protein